MDPAGKRQRRSTNTTRAEKAFAAVLAISVISITAVLITIFFVVSSFYFNGSIDSEALKDLVSASLEAVGESIK